MGNKIKIFFLGSGDFAIPYLKELAKAPSIELVGVGTQPDRPSGRKRIPTPTPLGAFADTIGYPCERIESVNDETFHHHLEELAPDMIVVVSFGQLLKEWILNFPRLGCLNVHGSILPRHRGAAPITSMILSRDTEAGVTFMRMDKGLDTGPIYEIHRRPLEDFMTRELLNITLSEFGAKYIVGVVTHVAEGLQPVPQDHSKATVTRKILKTDGSIKWNDPADLIALKIRAYYSWPGSAFRIVSPKNGMSLIKVTKAVPVAGSGEPGTSICTDRKWVIACGTGAVEILRLIPEGSREMAAADFLRGFPKQELLMHVFDGPQPPDKNTCGKP